MTRADLINDFDRYQHVEEWDTGAISAIADKIYYHKEEQKLEFRFKIQYLPGHCKNSLLVTTEYVPNQLETKYNSKIQRAFEFKKLAHIDEALNFLIN